VFQVVVALPSTIREKSTRMKLINNKKIKSQNLIQLKLKQVSDIHNPFDISIFSFYPRYYFF